MTITRQDRTDIVVSTRNEICPTWFQEPPSQSRFELGLTVPPSRFSQRHLNRYRCRHSKCRPFTSQRTSVQPSCRLNLDPR